MESIQLFWEKDDSIQFLSHLDSLTVLMVLAANNVRRGAEELLPPDHAALLRFTADWPELKDLRDTLEHFDAYALGAGKRQSRGDRTEPHPFSGIVSTTGSVGRFHSVDFESVEHGKTCRRTVSVRDLAQSCYRLVRAAVDEHGPDRPDHVQLCPICTAGAE